MTTPAEKILSEAICAQLSSSLLAFIRMKELPQIMHNKINIPQLTNRSFFIMMRKGQQSASTKQFFYRCYEGLYEVVYCVSFNLPLWEKFH
jgi:hypothetical protein